MEEYKELDITKVCSEITNEKIEKARKELRILRKTRKIDSGNKNEYIKNIPLTHSTFFMNTVEIKDNK